MAMRFGVLVDQFGTPWTINRGKPRWSSGNSLPFDRCSAYVGYWDGMDVERIIGDIEQLQEMFEAPDIRPLSASDISAANRRHDETL